MDERDESQSGGSTIRITRRNLLKTASAAAVGMVFPLSAMEMFAKAGLGGNGLGSYTFFVIGDSQIGLAKWGTAGTEQAIDWMNDLPGQAFPAGGTVGRPKALLILGDLQDNVHEPENWAVYKRFFDVNGHHAKFKYPVIECAGNHDFDGKNKDGQMSVVQKEVMARDRRRRGQFNYDEKGYHYSWDWGAIHYVCLNVFPGTVPREVYGHSAPWNDPQNALPFLARDLKEQVGDSGRPVILMWHYGLRGWGLEKWWLPEDLTNLKNAIAPYNVVLILHGHEHEYARYQWEGYDVIMAPSPQKDRDPKETQAVSKPKGFVVIRVVGPELQTALYTADGWSQEWNKKMAIPAHISSHG